MAAKPKQDVLDDAAVARISKDRIITGMQAMSRTSCARQLATKWVLARLGCLLVFAASTCSRPAAFPSPCLLPADTLQVDSADKRSKGRLCSSHRRRLPSVPGRAVKHAAAGELGPVRWLHWALTTPSALTAALFAPVCCCEGQEVGSSGGGQQARAGEL
jgi:hypothetical protein